MKKSEASAVFSEARAFTAESCFDPGRHQSPRERCSVQSSQTGELNSIDFTEQTNPLSLIRVLAFVPLCVAVVRAASFEAWLEW